MTERRENLVNRDLERIGVQLRTHISYLQRKILQLREASRDFEASKSLRFSYAVDFSEVYSYLFFGLNAELDLLRFPKDLRRKLFNERRIALVHLFEEVSDRIFLLPPHADELWGTLKRISREAAGGHSVWLRVEEAFCAFEPRHRKVLEMLSEGKDVGDNELADVISVIAADFDSLCASVGSIVSAHDSLNAVFRELGRLKERKRLVTSIDPLLRQCRAPLPLPQPDGCEIERLMRWLADAARKNREEARREDLRASTSREDETGKKVLSRAIDAKALISLREANAIFREFDARLVLVTRDLEILRLAREPWLAKEGFAGIEDCVRSIDGFFLDFLLRGFSNDSKCREWIQETGVLLGDMEEAALSQLRLLKRNISAGHLLQRQVDKMVANSLSDWASHINLRLSRSASQVDWYSQASKDAEAQLNPDTRVLLRNLWTFVCSPVYADASEDRIAKDWGQFLRDTMISLFVGVLGEAPARELVQLLVEDGSEEVRVFTHEPSLPGLSLVNGRHRAAFLKLRTSRAWTTKTRGKNVRNTTLELVGEIIAGGKNPEAFLVIGFVLALLGRMRDAARCIDYSLTLEGDMSRGDAYLLLGTVQRILAIDEGLVKASTLEEAFDNIRKAEAELDSTQDARLVCERASLVILFHNYHSRLVAREPTAEFSLAREDPKKLLGELRAIRQSATDEALKLRLITTEACGWATLEEPDFQSAREALSDAQELRKKSKLRGGAEVEWTSALVEAEESLAGQRIVETSEYAQRFLSWGDAGQETDGVRGSMSYAYAALLERRLKEFST